MFSVFLVFVHRQSTLVTDAVPLAIVLFSHPYNLLTFVHRPVPNFYCTGMGEYGRKEENNFLLRGALPFLCVISEMNESVLLSRTKQ